MFKAEYDYDTDIKVKKQESWEEGIAWQKAQSEKEFSKILSERDIMWDKRLSEQDAKWGAIVKQLQAQIASLQAAR